MSLIYLVIYGLKKICRFLLISVIRLKFESLKVLREEEGQSKEAI